LLQRLPELCGGAIAVERLVHVAGDLVLLGEARHADRYALSLLLVILVAAASDGQGTDPGGTAGEQWRTAFARAAAGVIPLRVLYEHGDDADLVCASAIALRCLTYNSEAACAHAGQLKAAAGLIGALAKHGRRPDIARELLAALANCGSDAAVRRDFQDAMPESARVLSATLERSSGRDPDVLAQGCRALGALTASVDAELPPWQRAEMAAKLAPEELARIREAVKKTARALAAKANEAVEYFTYLGLLNDTPSSLARRDKLNDLCEQLLSRTIASGPRFGRLLDRNGEPTAECLPQGAVDGRGVRRRSRRSSAKP